MKYLEVMFDEDPKLYRPVPSKLKGIEPEFTPENVAKVRKKVEKELAPDPKLDALAGSLARVASAHKAFSDKRKQATLAEPDLQNCSLAIDAAVALLNKYAPVKPAKEGKPEPHAEMKKYAEDLAALGEDLKKDLIIEYMGTTSPRSPDRPVRAPAPAAAAPGRFGASRIVPRFPER